MSHECGSVAPKYGASILWRWLAPIAGSLALTLAAGNVGAAGPAKTIHGSDRAAREDESAAGRAQAIPVTVDSVSALDLTLNGEPGEFADLPVGDAAARSIVCPAGTALAAHTDSNFGPGEYFVQFGFAEDEIFAAQYTLEPDDFPLTIRQIDFLIAQDVTIVQTTTHYTLFVWDGLPDTAQGGIEIARFNSTEDLPPVVMDAGLPKATRVQVQIDPDDANQIIIENLSGTNSFSVGVRIDAHNNPPEDPCNPGADPTFLFTNAFPAADRSGVASPSGNWIFALNCPGGDCEAGWHRFNDFSCTPSGDWVIAACYDIEPQLTFGACCDLDQACHDDVDNITCGAIGGTFFEDTPCSEVTCPEPTGACCAFGTCLINQTEDECTSEPISGSYLGNGSTCGSQGACCLPDGSCEELYEGCCVVIGGSFQGAGTVCAGVSCPQPTGACCFGEVCVDGQPQDTCETTGVWMGPDTTCDCNPCIGIDQADPPSGTVDARQPHPVNTALPRQGIGSVDEPVTITLGAVGLEACFDLCETVVDPLLGVNAISGVVDLGGGVYEIVLDHAITAGAVTTIQYKGDGSFVEYISHPANADADAGSAPADILVIIDVLNGVRTPVHGHYSQDIDHDGEYGPADILRLIDLLNGAGAYDPWLDVTLPENTSCP
jgi:hypothetical protein